MDRHAFVLMEGKPVRAKIYDDLKSRVTELAREGITPKLATMVVGDDPASLAYVRGKGKSAARLGIDSDQVNLAEGTSQEEIISRIDTWNADSGIHGILVQLPLPHGYDEPAILENISLTKDVDGFHKANMGALAMKGMEPLFAPCTPRGIMEMLRFYNINIQGKEAVVLGRSNIVGIPMALLLMHANATVTIAHSRTADLPAVCRRADILVAAVGRAEFVRADMVKEGAVVVDVGINRREGRLVGDVAFEEVKHKAAAVSPVPGGVGPLTVAMLMSNLVEAAERTVA